MENIVNLKSENGAPAPWWSWSGALQRFVTGLIEAELTRLRPGRPVLHDGASGSDLVADLGARVAVVSVGPENDYGHPAAATLSLLRRAGMSVERTDEDGDVALTVRDGRLEVRTRGGS